MKKGNKGGSDEVLSVVDLHQDVADHLKVSLNIRFIIVLQACDWHSFLLSC